MKITAQNQKNYNSTFIQVLFELFFADFEQVLELRLCAHLCVSRICSMM